MFDVLMTILMVFGFVAGFLWTIAIAAVAVYYILRFWWKIKEEERERYMKSLLRKNTI